MRFHAPKSEQQNEITDLEEAEKFLRDTLTPCDFAAMTVTLVGEEGPDELDFVQPDPGQSD